MSYTKHQVYAALPSTTRGTAAQLGGDPKGKNFLYTNGRSVIIRDIENPLIADQYSEHTANVVVAKYAPSGYYIASGDVNGNVRIWDTTQAEHPLKLEVKALSAEVRDLAWDSESKRIIAVGNGQECFGRAFMFDSGSSVGEIGGHSKTINSVDIKPSRPFRAITVSDDLCVNTFEGPPYKYKGSNKDHQRFINCVRYNSTGTHYATVSSDTKIFLFDGKTGEKLFELTGHTGAIFSCSWSSDGTQLMTASADKTVRLWDIAAQKNTTTFNMGTAVEDQQLGCLWQGKWRISVSLSGQINYLDEADPSRPSRVVHGHNKPLVGGSAAIVDGKPTFFSGDAAGRICAWSLDDGIATPFQGSVHTNQVSSLALQGDSVVSTGMDDTIRFTPVATKTVSPDVIKTETQPRSLATHANGTTVLAAIDAVSVYMNGKLTSSVGDKAQQAFSVAISPDGTEIAAGQTDGVQLFSLVDGKLTATTRLTEPIRGQVNALAYSPDGTSLAVGDSQRQITVFSTASKQATISEWVFHQARITSLAWSPSSKRVVSGSIDTHIFVWSVDQPGKKIQIKNAHVGQVNAVGFVDETTVASAGQDGFVKTWAIKHH